VFIAGCSEVERSTTVNARPRHGSCRQSKPFSLRRHLIFIKRRLRGCDQDAFVAGIRRWRSARSAISRGSEPGLGQGEKRMNQHDDENDPIPLMQKLLDNPFLLLFLGVLVPMLLYNLWGVVDILTVPMAK
jgi:hypothetical protein